MEGGKETSGDFHTDSLASAALLAKLQEWEARTGRSPLSKRALETEAKDRTDLEVESEKFRFFSFLKQDIRMSLRLKERNQLEEGAENTECIPIPFPGLVLEPSANLRAD